LRTLLFFHPIKKQYKINIKIDFENRYTISPVNDLNYSVFDSALANGKIARLGVKISSEEHPLLEDLYNFTFRPVNEYH